MVKIITTTELAARWKVSAARVRQWIGEGRLLPEATLPNGQHLFLSATKKPTAMARGRKKNAAKGGVS
jgi:hypothetical protein